MRSPSTRILGTQEPTQIVSQLTADIVQVWRYHAKRHAPAQVHPPLDASDRRRRRRERAEPRPKLSFGSRRQCVKHGKVRRQLVPFGREMRTTQVVQPREIARAQLGRDN